MKNRIGIWLFFGILLMTTPLQGATGEKESTSREQIKEASEDLDKETKKWMQEIRDEVQMDELDEFVTEQIPLKTTFSDLADMFWKEGLSNETCEVIADWIYDLFFYEMGASKPYFLQMLLFTTVFAIVRQIFELRNMYVSDLSFLMIYATMGSLLINNFILVSDVAQQGISLLLEFMAALIPTFATTLLCAGNATSAGAYYELSFLLITVLTWMMDHIFIPGIHVYLLICFLDQLFWEEKLSKMAEVIASGIRLLRKSGIAVVLGISCVQSLLTPAQDRMNGNVMVKTMSAIPGIGNVFTSAGDVLLSCGMLIKNSVGAAALILMILVCITPVIKVFLFTVLYRVLTAILQPVADQRIVRCMNETAKACQMYLKLLTDSMLLFFLTVAMLTASTSFIN